MNLTVGIIFLGTPLLGTKLQPLAQILAAIMRPAASHNEIINELSYEKPTLRDKLDSFCRIRNNLSIPTCCFFEYYETDYGRRGFISGVVKGMVRFCAPRPERVQSHTTNR
ncbi:hypothetical protein IMZ48_00785 [Candidatus Bathyarchaeota archaeon]|nr:hypothetical protein [Candidatus Bathyarchaeota archaeon]